ncbi:MULTISPECIES: hypothetical protein [unclassified Mesorhizobium]|uniref:hypothetical protein n=1 Tax=unclassified Mesorhizobium TaxID=325217 RepID=UPI001093EBC8|nr:MULTISPECIES: hypothetical protein [unclassified Mesorhizobium]TGQ72959.1 hypothetical protein EN848_06445 [bacterium M00.F.Ca.ET.205.01.1.1]TGU53715.1 hypothetical protein EN795_10865 [bacterium M00.F.Ca.ET.152.01.1.1]TGV37214.1 hypothetical protein EN829_010890 [Mesorhizobium sp. M00.F.Ca.ET.186.01.1.1]TGZ39417.1 hypothetical protein EN805_29125 [bacterium M00.F.Ca.ET.162.01.1.1]TGT92126.1 hypothetical protein EN804_03480 [Mesorhizobium sp. M8A.F.Ca.ET.161.01.1.1]
MNGSALSRWTMAYFAAALAFLIAAQAMMIAGYGFPTVGVEAPETLVIVHMITIGWLSLLMCGALLQFVPVLVAQPLRDESLALPALICLLVGLFCLLAGFLQLSGVIDPKIPFLALGGLFLPAGFSLIVWVLGRTLWSVRPSSLQLPARFVAGGLACVAVTAALGASFAFVLSGQAPGWADFDLRTLALPIHVTVGLGGWLGFTAIGVSYRLLPMFMLSPDSERTTGHLVLWTGAAALGLIVLAEPLEVLSGTIMLPTVLAGLLGLVATVIYGVDLVFFYRNRKRRKIELNSRSAIGAFAALYLSVLLLLALFASGTLAQHVGATVYLVAFGWLTGLGLSQLYKIVPFLTWLECYGPVMGTKPTPRVQDLVVETRDRFWFALYYVGVLAGTGALLAEVAVLFRIATAVTLFATAAIVVELVLARRLVNVAAGLRLPEGASRPRLFLPSWR